MVVDKDPAYVIFCAKSGVSKGPGRRDLTYSDKCEVVKVNDVGPHKTKAKGRSREESGRQEIEANRPMECSTPDAANVEDSSSPKTLLLEAISTSSRNPIQFREATKTTHRSMSTYGLRVQELGREGRS